MEELTLLMTKCTSLEEMKQIQEKLNKEATSEVPAAPASVCTQNHNASAAVAQALREHETLISELQQATENEQAIKTAYETDKNDLKLEYYKHLDALDIKYKTDILQVQRWQQMVKESIQCAQQALDSAHRKVYELYSQIIPPRLAPHNQAYASGIAAMQVDGQTPVGATAAPTAPSTPTQSVHEDSGGDPHNDGDGDWAHTEQLREQQAAQAAHNERMQQAGAIAEAAIAAASASTGNNTPPAASATRTSPPPIRKTADKKAKNTARRNREDKSDAESEPEAPIGVPSIGTPIFVEPAERAFIMRAVGSPSLLAEQEYAQSLTFVLSKYGITNEQFHAAVSNKDEQFFSAIMTKEAEAAS